MHAWEIEWYEFPILFDSQKNFTAMQIIDKCNENEGQNYFRVVDENHVLDGEVVFMNLAFLFIMWHYSWIFRGSSRGFHALSN